MAEGSRTIKLEILGDAKGAQSALAELSGSAEKHGSLIKNSLSTAFGVFSGEAAKDAVGEFGKTLIEGIESGTKSVGQFQAKLGLTKEEAQKLSAVSTAVWKDGWGSDLEDVNEALTATKQQFSGIDNVDLQNLTEQGLILKSTFGVDVPESVKTVQTMVSNFGITGSDAFDLITKSMQEGGDKSGDLLDTFNEYSVQFKGMGFDAKEFSNILVNGLSNGAFNADKVADSVKEFNIRIRDGSSTTQGALKGLGIDLEKFNAGLSDGSITGKQAMETINDALRNTQDQTLRNQLGVALYGTQWEDMGQDVILALDQGQDSIGDFQGATQAAGAAVSQDLGSIWTSFSRSMIANLQPALSDAIALFMTWVPTIQQILGQVGVIIQQVFTAAMPYVQAFFGWLSENGPNILNGIGNIFTTVIVPAFLALGAVIVNDVWPAVQNLWTTFVNDLLPVLIQIGQWFITNILPTLGQFAGFIIGTVLPAVVQLIAQFVQFLLPVITNIANWISTNLVPAFQLIANYIVTNVVPAFQQIVTFIQTSVMPVLTTIVGFLGGAFATAWNVLSTLINTVWTAISGFIRDNWSTISGIFNAIVSFVTTTFTNTWNTLSTVISTVWTAISGFITQNWSTIKGIFDVITGVVGGAFTVIWNVLATAIGIAWNNISTAIGAAWTVIQGIFNVISGVLGGAFTLVWNQLKTSIELVWNGISTAISVAWTAISGIFTAIGQVLSGDFAGAWKTLQDTIGNVWTAIKDGIGKAVDAISEKIGDIIKFVGDIPGKALAALGDIGSTLFNAGGQLIQGLIDGIKSLHIPLPHVNVSFHDAQVGPVTVPIPSFGVDWYKDGGIFNGASVIGVGEAGPEAVLPIEKLSTILSDSLQSLGFSGGAAGGTSEQSLRQMMREEIADMLQRSNPTINQTIYGVMPEDVAFETKKALRSQAIEMAFN
jgi:phage-related minor tail protein